MKIKTLLLSLLLIMALSVSALAATTNPSPASPGYQTVVIPLMGNYTSTRTSLVKFTAPVGYLVKSATIAARAVAGTTPTLKVRGKNGSYVNYSGTISTTTTKDLTVVETTVTGHGITDETLQAIDLVAGGTSPVFTDLTLMLFLKRK